MTLKQLPKTNQAILAYSFTYDGSKRIVDNVLVEPSYDTIIGFEIRKSGKWSYKVKRYKIAGIDNLVLIDPPHRTNRPEKKGA